MKDNYCKDIVVAGLIETRFINCRHANTINNTNNKTVDYSCVMYLHNTYIIVGFFELEH